MKDFKPLVIFNIPSILVNYEYTQFLISNTQVFLLILRIDLYSCEAGWNYSANMMYVLVIKMCTFPHSL